MRDAAPSSLTPFLSRRTFLQTAAAATFASGLPVLAANPITRNGKPFFKLSLAAYSFHRQMVRNWPKPSEKPGAMSLVDVVNYCAEENLDAVELTSYYFPNPLTPAYLMQLKEQTFRLGLDISGTAIGNDFCLPPGPERDAQLALCRQWIDYAADMGAPVIRIFAGQVPKGDTEENATARCVAAINESLQYAAQKGIVLGLENHHGITSTPEQLLNIVRQVEPSPWFGINFDSGNFKTADPYGDLEKIAPYAVNAQIKVVVSPNNGSKVPTDLKRVVSMLKQANYRGYIVLEYEEPEDPRVEIPKYLDQLRELIA
ncbi:TIM barrel protein [Planctomicrobium piriforme]|uniref:Sugar phosphate isomerase/epimerase n=1 Tax=Planctomicrobium piriforme TaxID=1576369 RepID=A0A1I3FV83_9PLAN|nr:TIM barrel protein [Planctomicrobium piriforme]SFI15160.1 Sugar phosphate isomerase/epimerase [Planctomicrobium piriforme]